MPKIPRDLSGSELAKLLVKYGYVVTRQTGSHMGLISTYRVDEHKITIPSHGSIRLGTLNSILKSIAEYLGVSKKELMRELFEK